MLKIFSGCLLALLLVLGSAPAHAAGTYEDPDTAQPTSPIQVLPQRCTGPGLVLPTTASACQVTRYRNRPTVFVWGDSHAWQQTPALIAQARATRTNLVAFEMGACPPMDLRGTPAGGQCARLGTLALRAIARKARHEQVTVVLGGAWGLYADLDARMDDGWVPDADEAYLAHQATLWRLGTPAAFRTLARLDHVRTVAMAQMPMQRGTALDPDGVKDGAEPAPDEPGVPRDLAIPREQQITDWLARSVDQVVDATRYVCDVSWCYETVSGKPTWLDVLHLNPAISTSFAPAYAGVFRR